MNMNKAIWLMVLLLFFQFIANAQTQEWKNLHQGNRCFMDRKYDEAEKFYREALKINPNNPRTYFNLGDTYLAKNDPKESMKQFQIAAKTEKNKTVRSMAHHNMGYILQTMAGDPKNAEKKQDFLKQAIEAYKEALRNNPKDDDTRYNLALCQKQLKDEKQRSKNQQKQQQKQKQKQGEQLQEEKNARQQPQQKKEQQDDTQTEQLLNLSRQAEKQTRERINAMKPRRKSLNKNW